MKESRRAVTLKKSWVKKYKSKVKVDKRCNKHTKKIIDRGHLKIHNSTENGLCNKWEALYIESQVKLSNSDIILMQFYAVN